MSLTFLRHKTPGNGDHTHVFGHRYRSNELVAPHLACKPLRLIAAVIAIPIRLVSNVKIKTRQKLGIGFFLCLSCFMVVIEVIRVSNVHVDDFQVWANFWIQIEGCTAVLTVSLTAFRTFFVSDHSNAGKRDTGWTHSSRRLLKLRKIRAAEGDDEAKVFITIPQATMTSMRAFIRGGRNRAMLATEDTDDSTIHVSHDLSRDSESVSKLGYRSFQPT